MRRWAADATKEGQSEQASRWIDKASAIEAIVKELLDLRQKAAPLPTKLGDLSDLPEELRAELTGIELDGLKSQLVQVINSYGRTADLNQILVGLWRKFKVSQKRRAIQQRLWRMQADKLVWTVPKRKGVYSTVPLIDNSADFGSPGPVASRKPATASAGKRAEMDDEIPF